jgi:iron complex transport system permease protein
MFGLNVKKIIFMVIAAILLIFLAIWATAQGVVSLSLRDVFNIILSKIFPFVKFEIPRLPQIIVWNLRLPRVLLAIIAGAGLALAGTVMQAIMRNPLVSPFTIGTSSAAGFGASVAIVLGVGIAGTGKYLIIGNAFFFAMLSVLLVYGIARIRGVSAETLILAGIVVMYFFSALTSLLQYLATKEQLKGVVHWLFGNLALARWENLSIIFMMFLLSFLLTMKYAWDFNALAAGDEVAISLGVNIRQVRLISLVLATLITATIVCFTGIIGFVCLVAPHITRMLVGNDHRFLLPGSCLVGAILLLVADTIGRTIIQPVEIPIGIITSFIGVPMFLYLLLTKKKKYWQ